MSFICLLKYVYNEWAKPGVAKNENSLSLCMNVLKARKNAGNSMKRLSTMIGCLEMYRRRTGPGFSLTMG